MEGRRRKRLLSDEELQLWAHVTRSDEPLARAVHHERKPKELAEEEPATVSANGEQPLEAVRTARPASPQNGSLPLSARMKRPSVPAPAPFDVREVRKIARGRRDIDARLDLHGLRQQDAYVALRHFLSWCQAEGHRHVLIITGKGVAGDRLEERDFLHEQRRGVLRRLVPHWLSEPDFRLHVVSFTESALKHGGSGALYVTIRKSTRSAKV